MPEKFFKIEEIRIDFEIGMFKGGLKNILELRENNRIEEKPLNFNLPYYPEEKKLIAEMYLKEMSRGDHAKAINEIINYFQRPLGSIIKVLSEIQIKHASDNKGKNQLEIAEEAALLYLTAVLHGVNPLTGEVYDNSSVWAHPQIKEDIRNYLKEFSLGSKENE